MGVPGDVRLPGKRAANLLRTGRYYGRIRSHVRLGDPDVLRFIRRCPLPPGDPLPGDGHAQLSGQPGRGDTARITRDVARRAVGDDTANAGPSPGPMSIR